MLERLRAARGHRCTGVPALTMLCQGHNGTLLITVALSTDQTLRLSKYFLQVLTGIANAQIAADPGEFSVSLWNIVSRFGWARPITAWA
jgi:hypothetical protein